MKKKNNKYKDLVWRSVLFWAVVVTYIFLVELLIIIAFNDMDVLTTLMSKTYWLIGSGASAVLMVGYYSIRGVYGYMKSYNEETKEKPFWLESRQLKRHGFKITDWTKMSLNATGHVIGVEEMPKGLNGIVSNAKTTAVLGCLNGATAKAHLGFNLDKWQADKSKPTIFIFDTKKEMLSNYNAGFEEAGFEMQEIDLDKPNYLNGWNPFASILEKVEPIKELTNGLATKDGKYQGAGETFQTYKAARERLQVLQSELVWHIQTVLDAILPKYEGDESEEDAKTLLLGIMIAFTEDYVNEKMTAKQFSLYSLFDAIKKGTESPEELRKYLLTKRTKYSLARMTVKDVFVDAKAVRKAISTLRLYVKDFDNKELLLSVSAENTLASLSKPQVIFIKLSAETQFKERLSLLFLKQVCFKEQMDQNTKFLIKDNMPVSLYEPFLAALKNSKLDAIVEMNNLKEVQDHYGDFCKDISDWFDEKIWFHGIGKEKEYIELCKDNKTTPKSKLEAPMPIIRTRVLDKAKEEDFVLTSIKGLKPIFTLFAVYDYGNESVAKIERIGFEDVVSMSYDITLFQRDF